MVELWVVTSRMKSACGPSDIEGYYTNEAAAKAHYEALIETGNADYYKFDYGEYDIEEEYDGRLGIFSL